MPLPFLKNRDDGVGVGPVEVKERKPDDDDPGYDMLDAIADDMLAALKSDDKEALKAALSALCEHIQDKDQVQDAETLP